MNCRLCSFAGPSACYGDLSWIILAISKPKGRSCILVLLGKVELESSSSCPASMGQEHYIFLDVREPHDFVGECDRTSSPLPGNKLLPVSASHQTKEPTVMTNDPFNC